MGRPFLFLALAAIARAQVPSAAAAYESLLRLRTTATVLHITAHPDDEDGALLTWLARHEGVRTGLLTLTRGEGGANLIGPELFDALGIVRTEELLAADRYYGVDQFFTRAADFGFSKRLDETLEHWGEENVLSDCVRVVRIYRPDVIVTRFHGSARDGHGNHQAAGLMAAEVMKAAGDPTKFPEQLREGLHPWQPKKLYRSVRENEAEVKIDTGVYDPLLGESYRQFAAAGLSLQRSQGSGARKVEPGPSISGLAGPGPGMFDGIDTSLAGLAKLAPELNLDVVLVEIEKEVNAAIAQYDAREPWRVLETHVAPALRSLRAVIRNVSDASLDREAKYDLLFRLRNKEDEFVRAGNLLAAVSLDVQNPAAVIPGEKFTVRTALTNRAPLEMENAEIAIQSRGKIFTLGPMHPVSLGVNETARQEFQATTGDDAEYTRPYWSRKDEYRDNLYEIGEPQFLNLPYAPAAIKAVAAYDIAGVRFHMERPVPVKIVPPISLAISPRAGVVPAGARSLAVQVETRSNVEGATDVRVHLELPPGWSAPPADLHFAHAGEAQTANFEIHATAAAGKTYQIRAIAESNGKEYREGYQTIAHRDLEPRNLYRPAAATLTGVDVKVAQGLKVGYIMGAGDEVPRALQQIGIKATLLGPDDLRTGDLGQFDTIVVGIRASAVRDDYKTYNSRLLDYVKNGGNLVVQYQTQEFDAIPYGPYPFQMGPRAEEVSEENARITVLDPANPVFQVPNKITAADFDGWVEERGSKFMTEWAPEYKPLLECHDRDQAPQKGGLLQAHFGKGMFTYAAYAFYRQLPAGVPGAYRLFANLVSPRKP